MSPGRDGRLHPRVWWSLALALACAFHGARAHADGCSPESVGVDTSFGDSYCAFFMGSACGQVFEAQDTVLAAVSVWRLPGRFDTPLRLFVLELDSTGTPDVQHVLLSGPTVQIIGGDSLRPVRYRFVIDPPLILPQPGHYEFAVQEADPYCDDAWSLVADDRDPYPVGAAWTHVRSYPDCYLGHSKTTTPGLDLVFEVEFCGTTVVGVPSALSALPFQMLAPRPNPARGATELRFVLPATRVVDADLFDATGRRVVSLGSREELAPGEHSLLWDGRDRDGRVVPTGIYLVRMKAGRDIVWGKLVRLR